MADEPQAVEALQVAEVVVGGVPTRLRLKSAQAAAYGRTGELWPPTAAWPEPTSRYAAEVDVWGRVRRWESAESPEVASQWDARFWRRAW